MAASRLSFWSVMPVPSGVAVFGRRSERHILMTLANDATLTATEATFAPGAAKIAFRQQEIAYLTRVKPAGQQRPLLQIHCVRKALHVQNIPEADAKSGYSQFLRRCGTDLPIGSACHGRRWIGHPTEQPRAEGD